MTMQCAWYMGKARKRRKPKDRKKGMTERRVLYYTIVAYAFILGPASERLVRSGHALARPSLVLLAHVVDLLVSDGGDLVEAAAHVLLARGLEPGGGHGLDELKQVEHAGGDLLLRIPAVVLDRGVLEGTHGKMMLAGEETGRL